MLSPKGGKALQEPVWELLMMRLKIYGSHSRCKFAKLHRNKERRLPSPFHERKP